VQLVIIALSDLHDAKTWRGIRKSDAAVPVVNVVVDVVALECRLRLERQSLP